MKKIKEIKIQNFKAFQQEQVFPVNGKHVLVYGNKTFDDVMFKSDIDDLKERYKDRFFVHFFLTHLSFSNQLRD